jgi:hypothetical protein
MWTTTWLSSLLERMKTDFSAVVIEKQTEKL